MGTKHAIVRTLDRIPEEEMSTIYHGNSVEDDTHIEENGEACEKVDRPIVCFRILEFKHTFR